MSTTSKAASEGTPTSTPSSDKATPVSSTPSQSPGITKATPVISAPSATTPTPAKTPTSASTLINTTRRPLCAADMVFRSHPRHPRVLSKASAAKLEKLTGWNPIWTAEYSALFSVYNPDTIPTSTDDVDDIGIDTSNPIITTPAAGTSAPSSYLAAQMKTPTSPPSSTTATPVTSTPVTSATSSITSTQVNRLKRKHSPK